MNEVFDPHYSWLGIPPSEQPADYYRLLGINRFESNQDVVANAADRQMRHVRTFQLGPNAQQSQSLLNELATAHACLLNSASKARYDQQLHAQIADHNPPPVATPAPLVRQRTRRRQSNSVARFASIIAGGIIGIVFGLAILSRFFGIDVVGMKENASNEPKLHDSPPKHTRDGDQDGSMSPAPEPQSNLPVMPSPPKITSTPKPKAEAPTISRADIPREPTKPKEGFVGFELDGIDCRTQPHQFDLYELVDISKSWTFSCEFKKEERLQRHSTRRVFVWASHSPYSRPGVDAPAVEVRTGRYRLEVKVANANKPGFSNTISYKRDGRDEIEDFDNRWVKLTVQYDHTKNVIYLFVDGIFKREGKLRNPLFLDKPSPSWLGRKFRAEFRNVWIANTTEERDADAGTETEDLNRRVTDVPDDVEVPLTPSRIIELAANPSWVGVGNPMSGPATQ